MSEKPKPKASTRDAIRNAVQKRREPPSDLQVAPQGGLIQSLNNQGTSSQSNEQATQPVPEQGEQGPSTSEAPEAPSHGLVATVAISKIRPGRYQKRETRDEEKYQQLKDQIQELGFQFVAVLCPDPDDPAYYNLMMGGHLRVQAASEVGITEVSAIIREYDRMALAKGTYFENNGRQGLTPMEEGLIFQQCMDDEGWTQQEVVEKLVVTGGKTYISFCTNAATAASDLQEMLRKEPGRGRRCFYYLQRLDDLGQERAMELRAPIIKDFLDGKITTDEVDIRVKRVQKGSEAPLQGDAGREQDFADDIKQQSVILSTVKSFHRFEKIIGASVPTPEVRDSLLTLRQKIDSILDRG
jgi:ParB/RepB/Spo0J family partition protein